MVADLLQSETIAALSNKNIDKQGDDSGLESGHTSMNNGKHLPVKILGYEYSMKSIFVESIFLIELLNLKNILLSRS